ncbi:MAG: hypothetical protein M1548_01050 [Actinobacteria bacterium]|nr:hypothetical protein [Actinomycetota bacterium]
MSEKAFAVNFAVSCKNMRCEPSEAKCSRCIRAIIDEQIRRMMMFKCTMATTSNGSKRFSVSFVAICRKPDCSPQLPRNVACCTSNSEKCELCLRSIVMRSIRSLRGFHVKEIAVV